jgi:hypothetical protein
MTHFADVSGKKRFAEAIIAMGKANQWQPGNRTYHADDHVIARSYLWAARHGAGSEAIAPLRATFDAILAKPAIDHLSFVVAKDYESTPCLRRWCWCDALFMSPPAWVELSQQTGDPRYTNFAMAEFWATTDFLYDPVEQLFFRDSRFFERRDDAGRKQFWSRGNGWVFAGIVRHPRGLPKDNPHRPRMEQLFRDMAVKVEGGTKTRWLLASLAAGAGEFTAGDQWHRLPCLRFRVGREERVVRRRQLPACHRHGLVGTDSRRSRRTAGSAGSSRSATGPKAWPKRTRSTTAWVRFCSRPAPSRSYNSPRFSSSTA